MPSEPDVLIRSARTDRLIPVTPDTPKRSKLEMESAGDAVVAFAAEEKSELTKSESCCSSEIESTAERAAWSSAWFTRASCPDLVMPVTPKLEKSWAEREALLSTVALAAVFSFSMAVTKSCSSTPVSVWLGESGATNWFIRERLSELTPVTPAFR